MTTLTVWGYDSVNGADEAEDILKRAQSDGLVDIVDLAWLRWDEGEKAPRQHHSHSDVWRDTGWGALWGVLFGFLIFMPLIGAGIGAAAGAATGALDGVGIRESDIDKIRASLKPGTSALFVVTKDAETDRLAERFHGLGAHLLTATLDKDEATEVEQDFAK